MPPININSISITRKSPASSPKAPVTLHSRGKIKSVGESYDGKHAEVRVAHGRKRTPAKGEMYMHDRPESSFPISKRHAKHFPVGSHVKISMTPEAPSDDAGAYGGDDESAE